MKLRPLRALSLSLLLVGCKATAPDTTKTETKK